MTLWLAILFSAVTWTSNAATTSTTVLQPATPSPKKYLTGNLGASVGLSDRSSTLERSQGAAIKLDLNLNYKPVPFFVFKVNPRFVSSSGYTESLDTSTSPESLFYFQAATASLISRYFQTTLVVGALDLLGTHNSLLFDDRSFPGGRVTVEPLRKTARFDGSLKIYGEGAVPSSRTLVVEDRATANSPTFYSGGLIAQYADTSISLGYFQFANLPPSVASKSQLRGNEVEDLTDTDKKFPYEFAGFEASVETALFSAAVVSPEFKAQFVNNGEGPDGDNQAWGAQLGLRYHAAFLTSQPVDFVPYYLLIRAENNSLPSAYMRGTGAVNVQAYRVGLEVSMKNKFAIRISGGEDQLIHNNPTFQAPSSVLSVKIGTGNVEF